MLYLDASALVKRYLTEPGSDALRARFRQKERIFTSILSYAEVHTVLGRKCRQGELAKKDYELMRERLVVDSIFSVNVLDMDGKTLAALPKLVVEYPLKASDAVHLSSALWLRDMCWLVPEFAAGDTRLEFGVSDQRLAQIAVACGLNVFDPEESN